MEIHQRILRKLTRGFRRSLKHIHQKVVFTEAKPKTLFIFGAQRSGTNMLISVLGHLLPTRVYNEDNPKAFERFRLKSPDKLKKLVSSCSCKWVVFKCIMDSQNATKLLGEYPGSKAIWIYRNYRDVADSAQKRWNDAQRHIIRNIAERDDDWDRWYTENISSATRDSIRKHYYPGINEFNAGALKWYLRNRLFFELDLCNSSDRVLLVSYDDLVRNPVKEFERLSLFLAIEIPPSSYQHVHRDSLEKTVTSTIDTPVERLCEELMSSFHASRRKKP